jgi:hypothetical protein
MRILSSWPSPSATSYRPLPPFKNPVFYPHYEVIDRPDGVVVRARTRLPTSGLIVGIIATVVVAAIGVAVVSLPSRAPLAIRLFSFVPLTMGVAAIWCSIIVPLYRAGPEPTLIEFDRRTGRVRLPRAALELRIDQVQRIDRVEFEVLPREGRRRGIRHIHNVLAYSDEDGTAQFLFLFHAEFRRTCSRIADALHVPLLDINLGVVGSYEENA